MPLRIVQLTDCHQFADPNQELRGIATRPRLIAALADVRRRTTDFDLLVLTGDTAHDESPATYDVVRELLGDWTDRLRIIPGNHDDRPSLCEKFPQQTTGPSERVTFELVVGGWHIVGLDSQKPGETAGLLGRDQLNWLRSTLAAITLPTLLFVHHPPIATGSAWLDRIGLEDAGEFEAVVREHPHVKLIVSGHVHQELAGSFAQATVLTTPAVGPQFLPRTDQLVIDDLPPAYRVIELSDNARWSTQVLWIGMKIRNPNDEIRKGS